MALNGFPGHGTTQYTTVHHHRISHNDGDEDIVDEPASFGGATGYAPGPVPFVPRYGSFGGYRGGILGARTAYHPRHVHVGVGTPGVKVEVETAKRGDVAAQVSYPVRITKNDAIFYFIFIFYSIFFIYHVIFLLIFSPENE